MYYRMVSLVLALAVSSSPALSQLAEEDRHVREIKTANSGITNILAPAKGAVCTGAGSIVYDDGSFENGLQPGSDVTSNGGMVMRFDPSGSLASLDEFCVCFTKLPSSDSQVLFDFVLFDDDGPAGGPGTEFARIPAAANNVPTFPSTGFFAYDLSGQGVQPPAGSFYVGVGDWNLLFDGEFFICTDETASNPVQPAFVSNNEPDPNSWNSIPAESSSYRALGIRVEGTDGNLCVPDANTLCLLDRRYAVTARFMLNGQWLDARPMEVLDNVGSPSPRTGGMAFDDRGTMALAVAMRPACEGGFAADWAAVGSLELGEWELTIRRIEDGAIWVRQQSFGGNTSGIDQQAFPCI